MKATVVAISVVELRTGRTKVLKLQFADTVCGMSELLFPCSYFQDCALSLGDVITFNVADVKEGDDNVL